VSNPIIVIHDAATGETIEREMTTEELTQYQQDQAEAAAAAQEAEAAIAAQEAARASAAAKLQALGLSEAEIAALVKAAP